MEQKRMCPTTLLPGAGRTRSWRVRFVVGACVAICLGVATPSQARIPLELDQLDLAVHPADVAPAKPALDAGSPPIPAIAPSAEIPPSPVDEVDKLAPSRLPNRKLDPSTRFGELTGENGGELLQEFLQRKTIPLFRLNSTF
jgi:hypothetical protein